MAQRFNPLTDDADYHPYAARFPNELWNRMRSSLKAGESMNGWLCRVVEAYLAYEGMKAQP